MTPLRCADARRLLEAYHDGELPFEQQIAVDGHLGACADCVVVLEELRVLRAALRASRGPAFSNDDAEVFAATVACRWKAEQLSSWRARIGALGSMFDDLHLVYAGLGAALATAACVVVMLGTMRFATLARPDSLGAAVNVQSIPGAGTNLPVVDSEMETRWTARFRQANLAAEEEAVFALQDVVARQDPLAPPGRVRSTEDAMRIEALMEGLSRSRFRQDFDQAPAAANMVWLVARTTVRPAKPLI